MEPFWTEHFTLPGQGHREARAVAEAIEQSRERVAEMAGCEAFEVVFTGSGTEANNLAVLGLAKRFGGGHLLVSAIEHDSVLLAAESLSGKGWTCESIPVDATGLVAPQTIEAMLREDTRLVCVQAASPYLGTLQNVREIADTCHSHGVPVHCDAAQAFGKIPVSLRHWRVDTMAISGHKIYGPKGSGALFVRRGYSLASITYGESREMGLRPGAENVPAIIGLGTAARLVHRCVDDASKKMNELRSRFIARLLPQVHPTPKIHRPSHSLPNTILMELPCDASRILAKTQSVIGTHAMSTNPADEFARSLIAIGKPRVSIQRHCRLSLGWTTSEEQIDRAADALAAACETCQ